MATKQVGGEVAVELARQLAEPIRTLRDRLGLVVDHLERHVATSTEVVRAIPCTLWNAMTMSASR